MSILLHDQPHPDVKRLGYFYEVRSCGLADFSRLRMASRGVYPTAGVDEKEHQIEIEKRPRTEWSTRLFLFYATVAQGI